MMFCFLFVLQHPTIRFNSIAFIEPGSKWGDTAYNLQETPASFQVTCLDIYPETSFSCPDYSTDETIEARSFYPAMLQLGDLWLMVMSITAPSGVKNQ